MPLSTYQSSGGSAPVTPQGGALQSSATRPTSDPNAGVAQYQGLQDWYNSYLPTILPQIQQGVGQYNKLADSIPGIQAQVGTGIQQYQQGAALQQQQLGLQGEQLGIQGGALARQQTLDPAMYALQTQGYANQGQTIQRNLAGARQNHAFNENDIEAAGVAGGSLFTGGQRQRVGQEKLNFDQQIGSLRDQQKQLAINKQGSALGFQEQMAQLKDSQANLGILQKQLGLSGQEITNRTQQAIQQLGLQGMVSVDQIHQAMVDATNGIITPFSSILSQIYQQSGIRPLAGSKP